MADRDELIALRRLAELEAKAAARTAGVAKQIDADPISQGARNFAQEMPLGAQIGAGAGKAFADIGQGAMQMVGMGDNAQATQERRTRDAPLMRTGGGLAGNVAGNVAALAPLALVPGAMTRRW